MGPCSFSLESLQLQWSGHGLLVELRDGDTRSHVPDVFNVQLLSHTGGGLWRGGSFKHTVLGSLKTSVHVQARICVDGLVGGPLFLIICLSAFLLGS